MEAALEAGADDVVTDDEGGIEVITPPHDLSAVKDTLEKAGFKPEVTEVVMKPANRNRIYGRRCGQDAKIIDAGKFG